MSELDSQLTAVRAAAVAAVFGLTVALMVFLPKSGYRLSRLVLFALLAGAGWLGVFGAFRERFRLVLASVFVLLALGSWQFTVGLFVLPAVVLLAWCAVLVREENSSRRHDAQS
ncbi:hypothetical protein [Haloarchaeobius sp. DT45]|uniref:hypothetical protein n=1 Tax=Haloarchaeobius sp. DT45 TaxID=3446116 RepID=UPI003F6BBD3C